MNSVQQAWRQLWYCCSDVEDVVVDQGDKQCCRHYTSEEEELEMYQLPRRRKKKKPR